jgi:hypothetical protein
VPVVDDNPLVRKPIDEDEDEDGAESDESDRKSKMSFSYWGADRVTVQPTMRAPNGTRVPVRRLPGGPSSYMRDVRTESSANAKFGTRLRESSTGSGAPERPVSRTGGAGSRASKRVEKPAWGVMSPVPSTPGGRRGSSSLTPPAGPGVSTPQQQRTSKATMSASPAPSVDSGIAVYLAQDSNSRLDRP